MKIAIAAAAMLAAAAPPTKLPPYAYSLRCAGLAEAAAEAGKGTPEGSRAYDAAIFWGMAASEAARKDKISGAQFTADQKREAATAAAQFQDAKHPAHEEFERCVSEVPPLGKGGERGL
jgi:hypothetical protein